MHCAYAQPFLLRIAAHRTVASVLGDIPGNVNGHPWRHTRKLLDFGAIVDAIPDVACSTVLTEYAVASPRIAYRPRRQLNDRCCQCGLNHRDIDPSMVECFAKPFVLTLPG